MLPRTTPTEMQHFLSEVEGTSYGGILREINAFLHHRKDADDDFLRRQKDKAQKYLADSNELSEKITSEWIGQLMEGLKTRISSLVPQTTFDTGSADNIKKEGKNGINLMNNIPEDDKKGFDIKHNIANGDPFTMLNEWLLLEFSNYQQDSKRQKDKLHARLNRMESDNFKRYKETLISDEEGLLRLFVKLRKSEDTVAQIAELVTMRKQEKIEDEMENNGFIEPSSESEKNTSGEDEMHWERTPDDNSSDGSSPSSKKRKISTS